MWKERDKRLGTLGRSQNGKTVGALRDDEAMRKSRMYKETKTWNPFLGCHYGCTYCKVSFQEVVRRFAQMRKDKCPACRDYYPHYHPERLNKIPSAKIIFVFGDGDINFCDPGFVRETIETIKKHNVRCPYKTYYFQSKNPACFEQYLDLFPESVILLTTLETNRDEGYELISKAPKPSKRYKDFLALDWPRKVPTIEPVMDFDFPIFIDWIRNIHPEYVWFGFNSRPHRVQLSEPSMSKAQALIDALKSFTTVKGKELRGLKI